MIFFIEGLSKSGKSTLCKLYCRKYNAIYFKGAGQVVAGIDDRWDDYNFYMHNIIERLDQLNNYKVPILWDRGLSESVYGHEKWSRLAKVHSKKFILFIDVPFRTLRKRNSLEGYEMSLNYKKYIKILSKFEYTGLTPEQKHDYYITDDFLDLVNKEIISLSRDFILNLFKSGLKVIFVKSFFLVLLIFGLVFLLILLVQV